MEITRRALAAAILLSAVGLTSAIQNPSQRFHPMVGTRQSESLEALGWAPQDFTAFDAEQRVHYLHITRFLNDARAAVVTTIDDSTAHVDDCLDTLDRYGIKATAALSTKREPISQLWPRLRQAVDNGHEIASHSRRHQCSWPDSETFCRQAYSEDELTGSRNDILANTQQPYVWSWVYPCGNCAQYEFIHDRLARAGYLVARNYPDEANGGVLVPDLQTWSLDPYDAGFTQVVQKKGGIAPAGRTDVDDLNTKFDEVYEKGGIYHFVSHPQWLDYGPTHFYERHLSHISHRPDVWYVPLGPLYAFQVTAENTVVSRVRSQPGEERFVVYNPLDPDIYRQTVTLAFTVPEDQEIDVFSAGVRLAARPSDRLTDSWNTEYYRRHGESLMITVRPNTTLEIRLDE